MDRWESLVDRKIREAQERGDFDDLPGKGRPMDLSENPYADPSLGPAFRMLKNAGVVPSFLQERREILQAVEAARCRLDETGDEVTFIGAAEALNSRIQRYNHDLPAAGSVFGVPTSSTAFELFLLSVPRELAGSAERRRT
jgi:Domain of unknown function (DUF1992)